MAVRKRITSSRLTLFQLRRGKILRVNPSVPLAVSAFCGFNFVPTWRRIAFAVWDAPWKRRRGQRGGAS